MPARGASGSPIRRGRGKRAKSRTASDICAGSPAPPRANSACYRSICNEGAALLGEQAHRGGLDARAIVAASVKLHHRGDCGRRRRADARVGAEAARRRRRLPICPDNTIHQALPVLERARRCPGSSSLSRRRRRQPSAAAGASSLLGKLWMRGSSFSPGPARARGTGGRTRTPRTPSRFILSSSCRRCSSPRRVPGIPARHGRMQHAGLSRR